MSLQESIRNDLNKLNEEPTRSGDVFILLYQCGNREDEYYPSSVHATAESAELKHRENVEEEDEDQSPGSEYRIERHEFYK